VKFYPLALQAGSRACDFDADSVGPASKALSEYSKWELLNLSIDQTIELRRQVAGAARELGDRRALYRLRNAVKAARLEAVGMATFFMEHGIKPPRLMVPVSAHYSWEKAMKVLGLGTTHLCRIPVDGAMRLEIDGLRAALDAAARDEVPVLGVVGMLGTTEFGAIDPIHEIVAERESRRASGLDFGVHIDAAWGGYLTSVFRSEDGAFLDREEVCKGLRHFPSEHVHASFRAIAEVDSVTVDPHKLGYVPYAAGAFVARNREVVDFITQQAAYVFDLGDEETEVPREEKLHNLGQYILEGSKSGAAAAAVHITHRVLPLDVSGFGRLLRVTIRTAEEFHDAALQSAERLADRVSLTVPFEPDTNLVCLALNPVGNRSLAAMNRFGRQVFSHMRVDADQPVQIKEFIGSYTSLQYGGLTPEHAQRILDGLGVEASGFVEVPEDVANESDHIFILRHTLMNPWLMTGPADKTYIELYWEHLERIIGATLAEPTRWASPEGNKP
jgi:glutamate/tyrosine decarboxylase-like PLP-dependent enzyme